MCLATSAGQRNTLLQKLQALFDEPGCRTEIREKTPHQPHPVTLHTLGLHEDSTCPTALAK